jgi:hypothetical protein
MRRPERWGRYQLLRHDALQPSRCASPTSRHRRSSAPGNGGGPHENLGWARPDDQRISGNVELTAEADPPDWTTLPCTCFPAPHGQVQHLSDAKVGYPRVRGRSPRRLRYCLSPGAHDCKRSRACAGARRDGPAESFGPPFERSGAASDGRSAVGMGPNSSARARVDLLGLQGRSKPGRENALLCAGPGFVPTGLKR